MFTSDGSFSLKCSTTTITKTDKEFKIWFFPFRSNLGKIWIWYFLYLVLSISSPIQLISFCFSILVLSKLEFDRRSLMSHSSLSVLSRLIIGLFWSHIVAHVSTQCLPLLIVKFNQDSLLRKLKRRWRWEKKKLFILIFYSQILKRFRQSVIGRKESFGRKWIFSSIFLIFQT